jgi:hypothetical protein
MQTLTKNRVEMKDCSAPSTVAERQLGGRMNDYPLTRLWMASVDLWASSWQFAAAAMTPSSQPKHAAIDPKDPASDPACAPTAVRSAGPEGMRTEDCPEWDKVDQAIDESFPASDPPGH